MNALKIYKPFEPFYIGQKWGNLNPIYAKHFKAPDFKRHNGLDCTPLYQPYYGFKPPIYCPVDGFFVSNIRYEENGGGIEIWLRSIEKLMVGDQECYALINLLHNHKILVPIGYRPALGELICIGNNTGFSTGAHTHLGLYRVDENGNKLDKNEATGSYDPELFLQEESAQDMASVQTMIKSAFRYYSFIAGL